MKTARQLILERLSLSEIPLALHQLQLGAVSQTAASARLREMAKEGLVVSENVQGRKYKAWKLAPIGELFNRV